MYTHRLPSIADCFSRVNVTSPTHLTSEKATTCGKVRFLRYPMFRQVLLSAAALAETVVHASPYVAAPQCYSENVRFMGAFGHPYYRFMPCCNAEASCVEDQKLGWGKFCKADYAANHQEHKVDKSSYDYEHVEMKGTAAGSFYNENVRCMGAAGYAHYQYKPCCNEHPSCVKDHGLGWGNFCKAPGGDTYKKPATKFQHHQDAEPDKYDRKNKIKPHPAGKHCYSTMRRCSGAPEKPAVEWKGFCDADDQCVEDASVGWTGFAKFQRDIKHLRAIKRQSSTLLRLQNTTR